ncbi:ABC transporter ATP-binding protein [Candidatus Chlorohelix sp.]|uniref:ABC transporter ATP-binding protein n=1 Tax=Candidatus Chlorohelix sp. TaxID=3139201 RepID=UPI00302BBBC8
MSRNEQVFDSVTAEKPTSIKSAGWKIKVENLSKSFFSRNVHVSAIENANLEIGDGEFYCLVGPSGCGKTTLLRIISGLEKKTEGQLHIRTQATNQNGEEKVKNRPLNSMVFQEQSVFPWMNVRDNISFGLKAQGYPRAIRHKIAEKYIEKLGLRGFGKALPYQLSGGMKQRVSVARAFATDPDILLMDEPFGALDEQTKMLLQEELLKIWEETRKTVIFVTHSIDEAIILADKIVVMSARPGRILKIIPVNFPRPRRIEAMRADPHFGEIFSEVWGLLRSEVIKAQKK